MPVQKFRSFEEARAALWTQPGSEQTIATLRSLLNLWNRLRPMRFRPGVYRYRSIDEAARGAESILAQVTEENRHREIQPGLPLAAKAEREPETF